MSTFLDMQIMMVANAISTK